jgi:hypothetical protein
MRAQIFAHAAASGSGLSPMALAAVEMLKPTSG